jgi:hypothetical protein
MSKSVTSVWVKLWGDEKPSYYFPTKDPKEVTCQIINWWANRWLMRRIQSDEVLARVAQHTLVYPVQHGARVPWVPENPDQLTLFDEAVDLRPR